MNARTRWTLGAILIGAVIAVAALMSRHGGAVTAANIAAIRPGMTLAEVERLLGGPPPGPMPGDVAVEPIEESEIAGRPPGRAYHWIGREAAAFVTFDESGRVESVRPLRVEPIGERKPWYER